MDETNPLYDADRARCSTSDDFEEQSDDEDYCYECTGYGDDCYVNEDGELVNHCLECPFSPYENDDD